MIITDLLHKKGLVRDSFGHAFEDRRIHPVIVDHRQFSLRGSLKVETLS